MKCEECQFFIEEFFDGELNSQKSASVAAHVSGCSECSEILEGLRFEQDVILAAASVPEPSPEFWRRVQTGIDSERQNKSRPLIRGFRSRIGAFLPRILTPAFAPAFVLLVLSIVSGVVLVKRYAGSSLPSPQAVQPVKEEDIAVAVPSPSNSPVVPVEQKGGNSELTAQPPSGVVPTKVIGKHKSRLKSLSSRILPSDPDAVAAQRQQAEVVIQPAPFGSDDPETSRHIERVQILMRSFRNSQLLDNRSELAFEKKLARDLLNQNIFLRRASELSGDLTTVEMLNSVEPLLLDIANLDQRPSKGDVNLIKNRIEKEDVVAALQVR
jgi:hypothetical protein